MSRETELNMMRTAGGGRGGIIISRPSTDQFRDNYDQINWHRPVKEKHTPEEWGQITGTVVIDPGGWRVDGKDFNEPIDREEWERRMLPSTVEYLPKPNEPAAR